MNGGPKIYSGASGAASCGAGGRTGVGLASQRRGCSREGPLRRCVSREEWGIAGGAEGGPYGGLRGRGRGGGFYPITAVNEVMNTTPIRFTWEKPAVITAVNEVLSPPPNNADICTGRPRTGLPIPRNTNCRRLERAKRTTDEWRHEDSCTPAASSATRTPDARGVSPCTSYLIVVRRCGAGCTTHEFRSTRGP